MEDGGKCAEIGLAQFIQSLTTRAAWDLAEASERAASDANYEVHRRYRGRGGTTLAALVSRDRGKIFGITVGDSRIYSASSSGHLQQVSVDDTIAGEVNRLRGTNSARADIDPLFGQLAQFVGLGNEVEPRTYTLPPPDSKARILLTSDGAHSVASTVFEELVRYAPSAYGVVTRIMQVSRWCGGKDNASVICLDGGILNDSRARLASQLGLLEVWDSFGKAEFFLSHKYGFADKPTRVWKEPDAGAQVSDTSAQRGKPKRPRRSPGGSSTPKQVKENETAVPREPENDLNHRGIKIQIVEGDLSSESKIDTPKAETNSTSESVAEQTKETKIGVPNVEDDSTAEYGVQRLPKPYDPKGS